MLTLTRRVGETIYLGDDVRITVYERMRYHVMMGVLAPEHVPVQFGASDVRPAMLPDGERFYLLSLLNHDHFMVGESRISLVFRPTFLSSATSRSRAVKVSVAAPDTVAVCREEVYLRQLQAEGQRLPSLPFSTWLHRANQSVCRRAVA